MGKKKKQMAPTRTNDSLPASEPSLTTESHPSDVGRVPRRWRRFRWTVRIGVVLFTVGYLGLYGCDSMFYHPNKVRYYDPTEMGLSYEDVHFNAQDGTRLHGWFVKSLTQPVKGTVIHFHGNAANISNHIATVAWLPEEGYQVLLFDYRGFGESAGHITRAGTVMDGHAALDYALSRDDVDPQRVYIYGQSLGGAVGACVAAARPEVAALVIESSFSSYRAIAARHALRFAFIDLFAKPIAWLLISGGHDPIDVIADFAPRPLLVIVCTDDPVCPPDLGKALYDAAGEPKQFLEVSGASHYQAVDHGGREVKQAILETFDTKQAQ